MEYGYNISANASHQFTEYYQSPAPSSEESVTTGSPVKPKGFTMPFVQAAVRGRVELEHQDHNPWKELTNYLGR